jgi:hypothetical protein
VTLVCPAKVKARAVELQRHCRVFPILSNELHGHTGTRMNSDFQCTDLQVPLGPSNCHYIIEIGRAAQVSVRASTQAQNGVYRGKGIKLFSEHVQSLCDL